MQESSRPSSRRGARFTRTVAGTAALTLAAGIGTLAVGASPASADTLRSQAVGRFLDGAAGGGPIQTIVDLHDARATNPGTTSAQNPLDITLGGQGTIPLSGKLQAPGNNVFHVGAANQIAHAKASGYALGAAGAVANQGGASLGGASGTYPSNATLDLSAAALPSSPIPLPGGTNAAALGGLTASIGAVSAKAYTPAGYGTRGVTHYNIAGLNLTLGSPALGALLGQITDALKAPGGLPTAPVPGLNGACSLKTQTLSDATVGGGALTIHPADGSLTIDVAAALRSLGANINYLPANTDLLGYVVKYLTSADGLSAGLQKVIGDTLVTQKANFEACIAGINGLPGPVSSALATLLTTLTTGQQQLTSLIDGIVKQVTNAGGASPLAPITDGLKQALQIGVNVQPNGAKGSYSSPLAATPDQATDVVAGQTIVRAIEIDLGGGQAVSLALANAAAGPGVAPRVAPTTATSTAPVQHNAVLPTGIPAGQGPIGGNSNEVPLLLLVAGLVLASVGGIVWRRGVREH